jgi:hypothetical protein
MARDDVARLRASSLILTVLVCAPSIAHAHERPYWPVVGCDDDLTVAVPMTDTPPVLDAALSEGEWDGAPRLSGFRRVYPDRGGEATLPTTVYLLAGEGHLYVAFECTIKDPSRVRATETREDASLSDQDCVGILIDSLHDHRRTIELQMTPGGGRRDRRWGNDEWDGIWDFAYAIDESAYVIEMDIDLASLTYEKGKDGTCGINFTRRTTEPYEDTAWAVDDTGGEWDPRCFPHLSGLVFPDRPAEQEVKIDPFTVATAECDDDGQGFEIDAGLDIEYPITTSITSRFTILPDLSNVEAAFKTIDVSYQEQFVPDTRDFFTHQAEYFGSRSLFHSGRVGDFDLGAKLTGTQGDYRVGLLDAWNTDTGRNDFVGHVTRQLGRRSDVSLSCVHVREPGFDNTALSVGFGTRFTEDSNWRFSGGHARSFSSDPLREGHSTTAVVACNAGPGSLGTNWNYNEVSPHFDPIDGYNPRQGFREIGGVVWKEWVPDKGEEFYSSLELFTHYHRGWTWDGGFYSEGMNNGVIIGFENRHRLIFTRNQNRHLEEQIRPQPFDDESYTLRGRFGQGRDLSGQGYFTFGTVEDSRLRQYGISLDWQPSASLRTSLNYNRRKQRFCDGTRESAEVIELGATKIINPEQWLSLRWYTRRGDEDISNLNLVYRVHKQSGREFFVILGDPLASEIRPRIALKYIHPIRF